ncbi:MAG: hypothetical protein ACRC20_02630 [Segniliparus sp.]|uniref:hypothetical protein n=1 Tax=Segniliparus sp. TaxID=2804064 RepID=UPI003F3D0647
MTVRIFALVVAAFAPAASASAEPPWHSTWCKMFLSEDPVTQYAVIDRLIASKRTNFQDGDRFQALSQAKSGCRSDPMLMVEDVLGFH